MSRILSPMPTGNGAYILHRSLEGAVPGYRVCGFDPRAGLFAAWARCVCPVGDAEVIHTVPDHAPLFHGAKRPLVITFHNYVLDCAMQAWGSPAQRIYWRTLLRRSTLRAAADAAIITAVSEFTADLVRRDLPTDREIEVIPNGIDCQRFCPAPRAAAHDGITRVLFSGNPTRRKGAHWLPAIVQRLDPGVRLLCTGGLRGLRSRLPNERVEFLGVIPHERMPELYRSVDLVFLPTVREGLSLAILEAMASGLPVVASAASSLPEQIVHGEGGLLVETGDIEGYARAINNLAADAAMRRAMGAFNRQRVLERYELSQMLAGYRRLFERLS